MNANYGRPRSRPAAPRTITPRRRDLPELLAAVGRHTLQIYRKQAAAYHTYRIIEKDLSRPIEDLLAEQDRAVAAIVDHAYINSPFYRRKFSAVGFKPGDVKGRADLHLLPTLDKFELARNVDDLLCYPRDQLIPAETGGTTGIPLKFYRDPRCLEIRRGIDLATLRYYGWRSGQWQGWLWGANRDLVCSITLKARIIQRLADRVYYFDALHLNTESFRRFADLTRRRRPTWVSAYPSLATDMARRIEAGQIEPFRVPMVNLTAEPADRFQKDKIRNVWAEQVYERYGAREYGMAALECPAHHGMHYFTESVYFEILPPRNQSPGPKIFVTDLLNYGMPLIRYDTGDLGDIDYAPCDCGRSTPRLKNIRGRETDVIWSSHGHGIAGAMFSFHTSQIDLPMQIQLIQNRLDHVVIRVAGSPGECEPHILRLIDVFKREISPNIAYEAEFVEQIDRAPSGKYRDVISQLSPPAMPTY